MITVKVTGDWKRTNNFLNNVKSALYPDKLIKRYAKEGLKALQEATPKDTGKTAASWVYSIKKLKNGYSIEYNNTNEVDGKNVAILLEYGHGTKDGGYVKGLKYIDPAIKPVFDKLANDAWEEIRKL